MFKYDVSVKEMWLSYLKTIGENEETTKRNYTVWHFCNDEESANNLAELVLQGIKRGTASLHYWYKEEGEKMPKVDDYSIIINWQGIAKCIIKTTKIEIIPFKDVTERFALIEGEGDKSLNYWRNVHQIYFENELKEIGKEFNEDMEIVFEEFELVYK
ncbi:MAG: ASCH domain-containing protein [Clostridium argentinense]|uniref:ASCH domain-containing protein n=1 Tax=Clostridium faecium TaxID=2762223 RepID=A0ABR8YXG9_9CLOT|nr:MULTISPECIES: ASCH domain-containing protein [Clostridium]MBD8048874.1 ASCH domain-containing protein [Clostridium faecium]MBS5824897.1 ASCH domain-containing protein [Clostridium argentinense]MDU1347855.1 ASCH domain-containing protein [Clostridium argentinense]